MDERREEFLKTISKIMTMVKVDGQLIEQLDKHSRKALVPIVKWLASDDQKKLFILTEFNRTTRECNELIKCLRVDGQSAAADYLKKYNEPLDQYPTDIALKKQKTVDHSLERYNQPKQLVDQYSNAIELIIKKTIDPKMGGTCYFPMDKYPRGQFILFVNVNSLCKTEGPRFEYLFKQLYFEVKRYDCLSRQDMMSKLEEVAKNEYTGDALFVMYVGHGQDEMLVPSWHEDSPPVDNQSVMSQSIPANDTVSIQSFVDLFAKNKCHQTFDNIPKIFVFNCCRKKTDSPVNKFGRVLGASDWKDDTNRTIICQSYAEGCPAFYSSGGFTQFGQAFSHAIAEFAYERPLNEIFNKVCNKVNSGISAMNPQVTMHNVNRALYLNLGYKGPE